MGLIDYFIFYFILFLLGRSLVCVLVVGGIYCAEDSRPKESVSRRNVLGYVSLGRMGGIVWMPPPSPYPQHNTTHAISSSSRGTETGALIYVP